MCCDSRKYHEKQLFYYYFQLKTKLSFYFTVYFWLNKLNKSFNYLIKLGRCILYFFQEGD